MQKGIWIDDNTNIKVYPYLNKDIETDVVVVGGGVSGAITAFFLAKEGFDVVVLEKNIIGCSNTSLSCGTITDFTDQMYIKVEKDKETINKMQIKANKLLDEILVDINNNKDLKRINHNIITTKMFQKGIFKAEQEKRNTLGQKVELLEKGNGIVIEEESRLIDTYELTAQIINYLNKFPNVHIYENTSLISFNTNYNGVEITTNNDFKIKAGSLILTTRVDGLNIASIPNCQLYRRFGIKLKTNFKEELSLKVLNDIPIYIRVDNFGNMIVSGIDTKYSYRMENSKVIEMLEKENEKRLIGLVAKIFPKIEIAEEIISFSGNILDTKDKLPIISEIDKLPNVYLNIGVGCSAIANVLVGADILKEAVQGYYKKEASLFKLNR